MTKGKSVMHVEAHIEDLSSEGICHLSVAGAPDFLLQDSPQAIELRFAASAVGGTPQLVIGLRREGAGIDLLLGVNECAGLLPEPEQLVISCLAKPLQKVVVAWDAARFENFLEQVEGMREQLPQHPVWRALADAFA